MILGPLAEEQMRRSLSISQGDWTHLRHARHLRGAARDHASSVLLRAAHRRASCKQAQARRGDLEQRFDRFYRYAELTAILQGIRATASPGLFAVESIGKSHEGRDIWVVTATNTATGAAADKPAFWIDGNIHAAELTASTACLYFLHDARGAATASDADITRLLDTRAFYVCPRINPDGAEWALADKPKYIRSSTRPYPFDEEPVDGLERRGRRRRRPHPARCASPIPTAPTRRIPTSRA